MKIKSLPALVGLVLVVLAVVLFLIPAEEKKGGIPDEAWIGFSEYDMIKEVPVTHWRGSLIFQTPQSDHEAPTLVAVPSCERFDDSNRWLENWVINPYKGEILPLVRGGGAEGIHTWVFSPPTLPEGNKRTGSRHHEGNQFITITVKMLRIEVIKSNKGWAVRSIDRVKKDNDPWVVKENYFYGTWLLVYREKESETGNFKYPDHRYFRGAPGLLLQYSEPPALYGFSRICL